jgi:hypothetical protein
MLFESIERHGADLPASADFHQLSEPLDVDKAVYHWVLLGFYSKLITKLMLKELSCKMNTPFDGP